MLFTPYTIKDVTIPNRIVMSPMCMYSCKKQDGKVTPFHIIHYASRAVGQVGLIMQEATAVSPEGRISRYDLGIWDDDQIEGLSELTKQVHEYGSKIGIQLAHAGRKADVDGDIMAPSPIPFDIDSQTPREMTIQDIEETVEAFRKAAKRAKKANYDIIELHAAHGYLINEFLSPLTNKRTDAYGIIAKNRYRFLHEIIEAVREVWDGPLFVRISATDRVEGGLTLKDNIPYVKRMKKQGVDLIDVSSGAVVPTDIHVYPGYQVPLAEKIKHEAEIPTGAVGLITSPIQAEEILHNNRADLVLIGRELLRDPYFPRRAAKELDVQIPVPVPYQRGWI